MKEEKKLICVVCGTEWLQYSNICKNPECNGFCTWGYEPMKPLSFVINEDGKWLIKPVPKNLKNIL